MAPLEEDTPGHGATGVPLDLARILDSSADVEEGVQLLFGKVCQGGALLLRNIVNRHPGVSESLKWILPLR